MPKFKYNGADLNIPSLGLIVRNGETVEGPDSLRHIQGMRKVGEVPEPKPRLVRPER